jgi:peptide/nickel transport system substrate-binding protein
MSVVIITGLFPQDSVAQLAQAQFREVGIDLSIKSVARPAWADSLTKGDDNLMIGWRGSSDPDSLRPQLHSSTIGGQINSVRIRDPKLDAMLEQGYKVVDPAERTQVYKDVQHYVMQNGLVLPVAMRINTIVAQPNVRGLYVDLRAYPRYHDVWLAK